jgi:hypothetical protein
MTTVSDALAEAIVALITGTDHWISLHESDPGETGAGETTVVGRVELDTTAGWGAAADDGTTGGRKQANAAELDFGTASGDADLGWACIWTASSGGSVKTCTPLVTPQSVVTGNPVVIPAGDLEIVGAGIS